MKILEAKMAAENFGRDKDLKSWNMVQFRLWMEFTDIFGLSPQDMKMLIAFGAFFYTFFDHTHKIPEVSETAEFFANAADW